MKMFFKPHSIVILALGLLTAAFTSCNNSSPQQATSQIANSRQATVLGYNGAMNPQSRQFSTYGELPSDTRDKLQAYIKNGEITKFDYIYPQYYILLDRGACWAICSDLNGNMTGILATTKQDARKLPASGAYQLITNETEQGKMLGYSIMKSLEPADSYRKSIRKKNGLSTPTPLPPNKPTVTRYTPSTSSSPQRAATPAPQPKAPEAPAEETTDEAVETEDTDFTPDVQTDEAVTVDEVATEDGEF